MLCGGFRFGLALAGMVLAGSMAIEAQQRTPGAPSSAQGTLTVTLTVVSSTGVLIDENGQQHVFVANAPDPRDNVSQLQPVRTVQMADVPPATPQKAKNKKP